MISDIYQTIAGSSESHDRSLIGESREIRRLRSDIATVGPSELTVLIQGPTGAGKELVAHAIHRASGRRGAMVAFNVCAITDSMFEDTLFGHVRGAFTGAVSDVGGYLAEANGGTLFLDEIGGLSLASQAKLLRVLETRQFRPVGGRVDRRSDFRLVAATNADLLEEVSLGRFRSDLAYRLSADVLTLSPLAERREDIPALARHFLREIERETRRPIELSPEALTLLGVMDWPGNVRELRNSVRRLAVYAQQRVIDYSEVLASMKRRGKQCHAVEEDPRRTELLAVLSGCNWNVEAAASALSVHPVTVYRRMKQFAIRRNRLDMVRQKADLSA